MLTWIIIGYLAGRLVLDYRSSVKVRARMVEYERAIDSLSDRLRILEN